LVLTGSVLRVDDTEAMDLALVEAQRAGAAGEVPVGAVILVDGRVVGAAGNQREALQDPTAHAEIVALRQAAAARRSWRLSDATMYVTLEPCPMCAGALVAARLGRLVFGAGDPKAGSAGSLYNLCADPRLNHELPVLAGVRAAEAASLLTEWFAERRPPLSSAPAEAPSRPTG
jgi:tRNA(adenine34) deaminase